MTYLTWFLVVVILVLILLVFSKILSSPAIQSPVDNSNKEEKNTVEFNSPPQRFTKIIVKKLANNCGLNQGTVSRILSGKYKGENTPAVQCVKDSITKLSQNYRLVYKKTTNTRLAELTGFSKRSIDDYFLNKEIENEVGLTEELELLTYDKGGILTI